MKVLLLGSEGMLGQAIRRILEEKGMQIIGADCVQSDFSFDLVCDDELMKCFNQVEPDIVINTAAMVSIDKCEKSPGNAYRINSRLPGILADLCEKHTSYLIHISTDHFYHGDNRKKHKENMPIKLMNEYARTKYLGECLALNYRDTLVLRTNIVGFKGNENQPTFLEWAINSIEKEQQMVLFHDFFTSPIHTIDFAKVLYDVIMLHPLGVLNLASSEVSSKKEFILALSEAIYGRDPCYQVGSVDRILGIVRGNSLGLDTGEVEKIVGYRMPGMRQTIASIREEYLEKRRE